MEARLKRITANVSTDQDVNRSEEIRTLQLAGIFQDNKQPLKALVYESSRQSINLRDVFLRIAKPSANERRILGGIIATHVRSLHVHFELEHLGIRTESFVFFGDPVKPDLKNPYVLDWGRVPYQNVYRHPEYEAGRPSWFYDVWSLMIILSEIAEWKPIENSRDATALLMMELRRKKEVMDPSWKGELTAKIMQYGFCFLEQDHEKLENLTRRDIKGFFDTLCALFQEA